MNLFTRKTSREAYEEIKNNGLLSRMKFLVYEILYTRGDQTGSELASIARDMYGIRVSYHVAKRLSELRDLGVIEEKGRRMCRITGKMVIYWGTTNNIPLSKNESIRRKIKNIDKYIKLLTQRKTCLEKKIYGGINA